MTPPLVGAFSRPAAGLSGPTCTGDAFVPGLPVPAAPLEAASFDPGAPPPTGPAGGPPPTLPAGAPPPTAALPIPAAPVPPAAPAPAPPPAARASATGKPNATNQIKAKFRICEPVMRRLLELCNGNQNTANLVPRGRSAPSRRLMANLLGVVR